MENKAVYYEHLAKDKQLLPLLKAITPRPLKKRANACLRLCASIMSQQLSTKVAEVIFRRFLELYGAEEPTPQQIIDTPHETLRSIGLSNAKANYMKNVAVYFTEHKIDDNALAELSNEEVVELLTPIKGVGKWTVEMLLMFTLGREDVFAVDDLGIQQGMAKIYNLDTTDKKKLRQQMLEASAKWAPYRTWGCFYVWDYKNAK
jgi:DNA-3-methyladenine glycosylase II